MKVFISSVIGGMEEFRNCAAKAIQVLGHTPIRAEDFAADQQSPQKACLAAVRNSDAVVLLLGARYGEPQESGYSPTHEEFLEAKGRHPIFVFLQDVETEEKQRKLVSEVSDWSSGHYRASFKSVDGLRNGITQALHRWLLSEASGSLDLDSLRSKVIGLLPDTGGSGRIASPHLAISAVGAPTQMILRPSQLEKPQFQRELEQSLLFSQKPIFTSRQALDVSFTHSGLRFAQDDRRFWLDGEGSIAIELPLGRGSGPLPVLVEETVLNAVTLAAQFIVHTLDMIDSVEKLSQVMLAAKIVNADTLTWRTETEQRANPTSVNMNSFRVQMDPVVLNPPQRSRSALRLQVEDVAEDLMLLLRRECRKGM